MTHEYAKEIHQFIAKRIDESTNACQEAEAERNQLDIHYYQGKLKQFSIIRKLLQESFDLSTQRYD